MVIDDGARLRRIQCKSGRYRNGAVLFATCSSYAHHPNPKPTRRAYIGQVDDFGVHCHDLGTVYLVPIEDATTGNHASLRVDKPKNNQYK